MIQGSEVDSKILAECTLPRENVAFEHFVGYIFEQLSTAWMVDEVGFVVCDALLARDANIALKLSAQIQEGIAIEAHLCLSDAATRTCFDISHMCSTDALSVIQWTSSSSLTLSARSDLGHESLSVLICAILDHAKWRSAQVACHNILLRELQWLFNGRVERSNTTWYALSP